MPDENDDAIELQIGSPKDAIQFIKNNIENEAKNIQVVKNDDGESYTGTASGFPTD